jgi:molybdopterin converting factor small subunit
MTVRVLAFARLREALGFGERAVELEPGATMEQLWLHLAVTSTDAAGLRDVTRFARNGALTDGAAVLADGDEIALMPPVGGG